MMCAARISWSFGLLVFVLSLCASTSAVEFIINGVSYPASTEYEAVYIVSGSSMLNVLCNHGLENVTNAQWVFTSPEFDPASAGPVPDVGEPVQIIEGGTTLYGIDEADGNTLIFFNPTPEMEGVFTCSVASLAIRFTFSNPYVAAVERNLVTTLVENLSLRVISLILEDGLQGPPDIADVTISSVNEADLVILTDDQNPDNPYETVYVVARPQSLVQGDITVEVNFNEMIGNDTLMLEIRDIYGNIMQVTVVEEGNEFVLNCTPSIPGTEVTFNEPFGLVEDNDPFGNIWNFTAEVQFSGRYYECTLQFESPIDFGTILIVYPLLVESDVAYFSFSNEDFLPNGYILLNNFRAEGLSFVCVTRSGTLSILSEDKNLTDLYATTDDNQFFNPTSNDQVFVDKGDRFILINTTVEGEYSDVLTCISDMSSDKATVRIIAESAYISVFPEDRTSAVVDYLELVNISFTFVAFDSFELRLNGQRFEEVIPLEDNNNDQILTFPIQARFSTAGDYLLWRNVEASTPNANFTLIVAYPVLSVSSESVVVNEGEDFTLVCTSSIPNVTIQWDFIPVTFNEFPPATFFGSTLVVMNVDEFNEGEYICSVNEFGENEEITLASASATVDVILDCPEHYSGGILWSATPELQVAFVPCQEADSRFSVAVSVSRICGEGGRWFVPNFSGCTLSSDEEQSFIIFSLYYTHFENSTNNIFRNKDLIQQVLDDYTINTLVEFPFFSSLEIVPDTILVPIGDFISDVVRMKYTVTYNRSSNVPFNENNATVYAVMLADNLHCIDNIPVETENGPSFNLEPVRQEGDTFGFLRSDYCECIPPTLSNRLPLFPDELKRKKRGLSPCFIPPFMGFQDICNGNTAAPCSCFGPEECRCQTPYVGNGVYCALDEDGDSFPSIVPDPICDINSTQSYCFQDVCPNVPNTSPTDDSPCNGLSGEGIVFCVAEADIQWGIEWPYLLAGDTITVPCGVDFLGNSSRICGSDGIWEDPDVRACSSRVINDINIRISLALADVNNVNADDVLELFEDLVDATMEPLFPMDVNIAIEDVSLALDILEAERLEGGGNLENATVIFEVLDNLLIDDNLESFDILEEIGGSQRLLENVERYALYVAQVLQDQGMDFIANRTGDNIVLRAQNVVVDEVEEYVFPEEMEIEGFNLTNGSAASISVPQLLLQNRSIGSSVGVASVLFRNLQAFLPNDSEATAPRSLVISTQVAEEGGNGRVVPILVEDPVIITFTFDVDENEDIPIGGVDCVFWDFGGNSSIVSESSQVRWSTEGLTTEDVRRDGNTITVVCSSTHLTSFAVLVDVGGARIDSKALSIVSYIGLAISLSCLLLTIIFFLTFGKKLFTAVHNFIHLNLAIALFVGYLTFALGLELANHEKIPCNIVTALIQYFLLSAFCWMMCEGIMLYLMLVVVFSRLKTKWWFFMLLGWGIPLIFVIIGLGAVHEEYGVKDDSSDSDDYYKYCWLSSGDGTYAIWTFVAPMLGIIVVNAVFLALVLFSIAKNRTNRQRKLDEGYKVDLVTTVVKASLILLPLLGLTWVFGLFAVNEDTVVFAWLFTIFNSLQGLFIFILHVLRNDRIWGRFKKRYEVYSTAKASKSTASTNVKSSKYTSMDTSTASGGIELKDKPKSFVDPDVSEVKTTPDGDDEPTKEAVA